MSNRRLRYLIGVIALGIAFTAPVVLAVAAVAWEGISTRQWPLPRIPGIGQTVHHNPIGQRSFWRNKFVQLQYALSTAGARTGWKIGLVDPETGEVETLDGAQIGFGPIRTVVWGDRVWLSRGEQLFELIDGSLKESQDSIPNQYPLVLFPWDGQPAFVNQKAKRQTLFTKQDREWKPIGYFVIPEGDHDWWIDGQRIHSTGQSSIQVLSTNDQIHLFVRNAGHFFYHNGLDLLPLPKSKPTTGTQPRKPTGDADDVVSAVDVENPERNLVGWSIVREEAADDESGIGSVMHGLMIDGNPAALIVDGVRSGNSIGHVYRFDGSSWNKTTSITFPFGSTSFMAVTTNDGQRSYIAAGTSNGESSLHSVDLTGIHPTMGSASMKLWGEDRSNQAFSSLGFYIAGVAIAMTLAIGLGLGISLLMWWYTTPDYSFGLKTVRLASLLRRGIARMIDLLTVLITTVGLARLMTAGFDWHAFFEALNLHADHPTVRSARWYMIVLAAWFASVTLGLLIAQAKWGLTPGKWLCRLRTVRTSLRPCGFASSLAREFVFLIECCYFFCWTPAILSIALTDRRQRLGDFVADTIVVDSDRTNNS